MKLLIADVNLKRYEYTCSDDRLEYYFDSIGPKGVIRKVVRFERIYISRIVYNLAFGDFNEVTGKMDDTVISNNQDREIIMATLGSIVLEFIKAYPGKMVYVKGFNSARTRLYQMSIASYFAEVSMMFEIEGYINDKWEQFRLNTNYESLLQKKNDLKSKKLCQENRESKNENIGN